MAIRAYKSRRGTPRRRRTRRRSGRGTNMYETSSTKCRRTPTTGHGIGNFLKGLGKFAAKNSHNKLKGARYLAEKSGNKTLRNIANSELLDKGADFAQGRFGGRGASTVRGKDRRAVNNLVRKYVKAGARKILRAYVNQAKRKSRGKGRGFISTIGKVANVLRSILPF